MPIAPEGTGFDFWYYVLDDSRMTLDKAQQYLDGLALIEEEVITRLPSGKMDYAPTDELLSVAKSAKVRFPCFCWALASRWWAF